MRSLFAIAALVACSGAWADVTLPNNLEENTVASAADVMGNFNALASEANNQDARISNLESQILPANSRLTFLGYELPLEGVDNDRACKTRTGNDSAHLATTAEWSALLRLTSVPLPSEYAKIIATGGTYATSVPAGTYGYEIHTGVTKPTTSGSVDLFGNVVHLFSPGGGYSSSRYIDPESFLLACVGYVSD